MTFGDKLINLRKQEKMTQEEVAEKLNITRQTVSNWELNQTKPDLDQLKGLSKLYAISIDELVDNSMKELLTQKVSNTEKLAGLIYKILKWFIIFFMIGVIVSVLGIILFSYNPKESVNGIESTTEMICNLNGEVYTIGIKSRDNKIIELGGDAKLINILDLEKYEYEDQVIDKVTAYFENNGGECE